MLNHPKRILLTIGSFFRHMVRLAGMAFPLDLSAWSSDQLIGLPTYQGLLEGLSQQASEPLGSETLHADVETQRPGTGVIAGEPRSAESNRVIVSVAADRGLVGGLIVREMGERYRLASRPSMLRSKKAQN
jgi:hypothetical protein